MRKGIVVGSLALAFAVVAAGVALGSHITTGSYTGCYSDTNGAVRLIKEPGLSKGCPSGYSKFTFPDSAATEARATFFTNDGRSLGNGDNSTWIPINGAARAHDWSILLDSTRYPSGSTDTLEVGLDVNGEGGGCIRIY